MRRLSLLLLVVLALVAAACTDSGSTAGPGTSLPVETSTEPPTTVTTVRVTTTSTTLRPTTTVTTLLTVGPGEATIGGTVTGPSGPVDGATVRIERLVGKNIATADVTTTGGGSWQMPVLGGAYRVRAFKPPDLGQSPVESFFLAATDRKTLDLKLPAVGVERITAVVNPSPPRVDQAATVTVQIGTGRVDDQGRSVVTPRPGVVMTLTPGAGIVLESAPQVGTDGNGSAAWRIRCTIEGANALSLTVNNGVTQVTLPACAAAPPPPVTPTTKR